MYCIYTVCVRTYSCLFVLYVLFDPPNLFEVTGTEHGLFFGLYNRTWSPSLKGILLLPTLYSVFILSLATFSLPLISRFISRIWFPSFDA